MAESDPSQGRPGNDDKEILTGKVVINKVVPARDADSGYDPTYPAPSYHYLDAGDHARILQQQDTAARAELTGAIRDRKAYHHGRPARHTRPTATSGIQPDQAAAMRTAKTLRKGSQ